MDFHNPGHSYAEPPPKVPIHDDIWFADGNLILSARRVLGCHQQTRISMNGNGDGAKYFANCNNGLLYPTMSNTITCRPEPGVSSEAGSIRLAMMVEAAAGAWLIM